MNQTHEPTLYDVMDILGTIHERFDGIDAKLDGHDRGFEKLLTRMDTIDERIGGVEKKVSDVVVTLADMQDDVTSILLGMDTHTEKIVRHERRIGALEKAV